MRFQVKHGLHNSPEYKSWIAMKKRCSYEKQPHYQSYGGRGIAVCEAWVNSFERFLADMGPKPSPRHTIDRIDGSKGYEPSNCRWATYHEQANNKVTNVFYEHDGKRMTLRGWARLLGTSHGTLGLRLKRGWSVAKTLDTPVGTRWMRYV